MYQNQMQASKVDIKKHFHKNDGTKIQFLNNTDMHMHEYTEQAVSSYVYASAFINTKNILLYAMHASLFEHSKNLKPA